MSWANPIVTRLAASDLCVDDYCGGVLICSWPMPTQVLEAYTAFAGRLKAELPAEAYVYPARTLHCTVLTLRAFTAGPLDAEARQSLVAAWSPVLAAARADPAWPTGEFRLRMGAPTLEGAAGIFRYEDCDNAIEKMRVCLHAAILAAGGHPAVGGGDRSQAKPIPSFSRPGDPAPHLPDIVHSTALRWAGDPADQDAAHAAFKRAAAAWEPIDITVNKGCRAVLESTPFMHMPSDDPETTSKHAFWSSD
tara:strand:+ start:56 stop:805 length:750 start_codon:yes stop_codon:yes gene_type:complete